MKAQPSEKLIIHVGDVVAVRWHETDHETQKRYPCYMESAVRQIEHDPLKGACVAGDMPPPKYVKIGYNAYSFTYSLYGTDKQFDGIEILSIVHTLYPYNGEKAKVDTPRASGAQS